MENDKLKDFHVIESERLNKKIVELEAENVELKQLLDYARNIIVHAKWDYEHDACEWLKIKDELLK